MGRKLIDLEGQKFGKWTVIEVAKAPKNIKGRHVYWKCKCECGTERIVSGASLRKMRTISCGCVTKTRKGFQIASFNRLYTNYRLSARKRNIPFLLSKELFKTITKQNCYYCGIKPKQEVTNSRGSNGVYIYNGIDRINSSKGYVKDNIVPCCTQCNCAKLNHSQQNFLSWVERVYNHSIKNKFYKEKNEIS